MAHMGSDKGRPESLSSNCSWFTSSGLSIFANFSVDAGADLGSFGELSLFGAGDEALRLEASIGDSCWEPVGCGAFGRGHFDSRNAVVLEMRGG